LSGGIVLFISVLIIFRFNILELSSFSITPRVFTDFVLLKHLALNIWSSLLSFFSLVFTGPGSTWWKSVLLIYILYSTGSSMTLSKSDVGSALSGFLWVVILSLAFNLLTLWIGNFAIDYLSRFVKYINGFYFLLILSTIANILFILMLLILNLIKNLFVSR
jgi:hypothetical protein